MKAPRPLRPVEASRASHREGALELSALAARAVAEGFPIRRITPVEAATVAARTEAERAARAVAAAKHASKKSKRRTSPAPTRS